MVASHSSSSAKLLAHIDVAVYLRVSTDQQEDSPHRQLSLIVPYLLAHPEYRPVRAGGGPLDLARRAGETDETYYDRIQGGCYVDLNEKGWKQDRPALHCLLADGKGGRFGRIVVDQGSRLSRQKPMEFFSKVASPLSEAGVQVESVERGRALDWDDVGDFLTQAVDQFGSNRESANTSWRVLSEWIMKAQRAEIYLGRPPYGYRVGLNEQGRRTYIPGPEEERRVVRYVFEAYALLGLSLAEICEELTRRGCRSPKGRAWRQSSIVRWLRDPVYVGTYRFNVTHYGKFYRRTKDGLRPSQKRTGAQKNAPEDWVIVPKNHVGLVDPEWFHRAQESLARNRRCTTPGRKRRDFLLAQMLVCSRCRCRMTGTHRRRAGTPKVYGVAYRCASSYDTGACLTNTIHEDDILPRILQTVQEWLAPERLDEFVRRARKIVEQHCRAESLEPLRTERARLEKQIARAKRNLSLLETDEEVAAVSQDIKGWRERVSAIDAELREAEEPRAVRLLEEAIEELKRCAWELREAQEANDQRRLRAVLRRLIGHVVLTIEADEIGKNRHTYRVTCGEIHLAEGSPLSSHIPPGLLTLFNAGPTTVQASTWSCRLASKAAG